MNGQHAVSFALLSGLMGATNALLARCRRAFGPFSDRVIVLVRKTKKKCSDNDKPFSSSGSNPRNNEEDEEVESFAFTSPSCVSGAADPSTPRTANSSRSGRNNVGRGGQVPLHPRALGIARRHPSPTNDNGGATTSDTMEEGNNDEILQQLELMDEEDALHEDHQRMAPGGDGDSESEDDTDGF